MSLSRILNDEPSPSLRPAESNSHPSFQQDPSSSAFSSAPMSPPPPRTHQPDHPQRLDHSQSPVGDHPPLPRGYTYQPVAYQGAGGWDPYTGEWVHGDIFPLGPGGNYYPERDAQQQMMVHGSRVPSSGLYYKDGEREGASRKRRKGHDDDPDYQPPATKRYATRSKQLSWSKNGRTESPAVDHPELEQRGDELAMDDDRYLASSDLSDCEEIWIGELSEYILETQKRRQQVVDWFERSVLERNSSTAMTLSRHYVSRIASIPLPLPPAPPPISRHHTEHDLHSSMRHSPPLDHGDPYEPGLEGYNGLLDPGVHSTGTGAEDAARELEESLLGARTSHAYNARKGKGKERAKRPAPGALSDESSDLEVPLAPPGMKDREKDRDRPVNKKRKIERDAFDIADELEKSVVRGEGGPSPNKPAMKGKGKGKQAQLRETSLDSVPGPGTGPATPNKSQRKKPGPKRKINHLPPETLELLGLGSAPASVSGDVTPVSRPTSPALTSTSNLVYELDDVVPPLKRAKKVDDNAMMKRVKALEEAQKKVWTNIARRDVAKVYKYAAMGYQARQAQLKRLAMLSSMQARRPFTRTAKVNKDIQAKGKRMMREMLVFWKKNEREERDVRKREQKEATDRAKVEEEKREAARQARKLEFLISQTELYSHFVGSKLRTAEVQGDGDNLPTPAGADVPDIDPSQLRDIDFDDDDHTNLHRHARLNAQEAISLAKQRAQHFDTQAALERKTNEALQLAKAQAHIRDEDESHPSMSSGTPLVDLDSDELNFQNPTSLSGKITVKQPQMLMAQLKEYQLKGLNWLATLYEQGINGILADEMGLGKTVQSISLLAYLAEVHNIWGPFLVVAPASTLHNWQQEITRFVPGLKALPYWGNVKERTTLRKFWSKKEISYNQDAPFHVLITSYQLITQDQQYFQRVKWQYMILDEAQNIKNSSSVRWKTLLGFQCRNRLLLTGTPIQNSMQELWALLHFIMPSLFDSHDEFNEWFSKDIENAAENKGSKLNEHQLRRLHMILKPFMLRRVKRHVQNELSEKIELDIYVDLSSRQRALYRALLANVSIADLLEKAANIGDADSARSLMNLVMQFRKVCNHPELFERADVVAPFSFTRFGQSGPMNREGDFIALRYSTRNPIEYHIPRLLYQDGGLLGVPCENNEIGGQSGCIRNLFNIWTTQWIHQSIYDDIEGSPAFAFLRLLSMSSGDAHDLHMSPLIRRRLSGLQDEIKNIEGSTRYFDTEFSPTGPSVSLQSKSAVLSPLDIAEGLPKLNSICGSLWSQSCLSRPDLRWFVPGAVAPPITMSCIDRTFLERQSQFLDAPLESMALYGLPPDLRESEDSVTAYQSHFPALSPSGLIGNSPLNQLPLSNMQVPEAKRLIYDSAKLARLDALLQELKTGDHRVLVYFQMTRMMDLMEEYLIYRQYKYLRLDGSSKLEDRRDMVMDWQTRPDIFVFLLSTRAGGLGINLTAADTVVFYDHDWNPSNDAQAMDRAHRLGQTRQVTVYRLITKGTIDERIIQMARVKKDVQDIVVGNKNITDVAKPSEIVQLLLNDDQLAGLDPSGNVGLSSQQTGKRQAKAAPSGGEPERDLWNDEGDDFFGHSTGPSATAKITESETAGSTGNKATAPKQGRGAKGGGHKASGRQHAK